MVGDKFAQHVVWREQKTQQRAEYRARHALTKSKRRRGTRQRKESKKRMDGKVTAMHEAVIRYCRRIEHMLVCFCSVWFVCLFLWILIFFLFSTDAET